jgi:hypothetical protein
MDDLTKDLIRQALALLQTGQFLNVPKAISILKEALR